MTIKYNITIDNLYLMNAIKFAVKFKEKNLSPKVVLKSNFLYISLDSMQIYVLIYYFKKMFFFKLITFSNEATLQIT